jgi:hypothetical protein
MTVRSYDRETREDGYLLGNRWVSKLARSAICVGSGTFGRATASPGSGSYSAEHLFATTGEQLTSEHGRSGHGFLTALAAGSQRYGHRRQL